MPRILIAEDERVVAWNLEELLKLIGHQVVGAVTTAADAIGCAEAHRPDLVIMDIRLGGELDGIAAARTIYEQFRIPSIYLTAHADDATLEQAIETAPFGYILKPFRRNDLLLAIRVALRRHKQEQSVQTTRDILTAALNRIERGAIATDPERRIIFMNRAAETLTQWQTEDACGRLLTDVVTPSSPKNQLAHEAALANRAWDVHPMQTADSSTAAASASDVATIPNGRNADAPSAEAAAIVITTSGFKRLIQHPTRLKEQDREKVVGSIFLFQDLSPAELSRINSDASSEAAHAAGAEAADLDRRPATAEQALDATLGTSSSRLMSDLVSPQQGASPHLGREGILFSNSQIESDRPLTAESQQIDRQTAELAKLLSYKELLEQITQKLRDNYDKHHVVQFAVQEVVKLLRADFGNAVFYNITEQHPNPIIVGAAGDRSNFINFVLDGDVQAAVHSQLTQQQRIEGCFWVTSTEGDAPTAEWFSVVLCPMVDDRGQVLGDILMARSPQQPFDSTDCSMLQQVADQCAIAIRQSYLYQAESTHHQELKEFSQLKDNFLSTISHELRTPIASIRMATQMLELLLPSGLTDADDERAAKYVEILKQECQREAHLIDNLLDITRLNSKLTVGAAYPVEIGSLVKETMQDFTQRIQQNQQQFRLDCPADLPTLITVPSYFKRVLSELMENACTYTPPNEHIWIAVRAEAQDLRLTVSNSGVSMPTSELTRLFSLFYRSPNQHPWRYGGTGLGLALAKRQTEQLGGSLGVETSFDENDKPWIRFILSFPLSTDTGDC